MTGGYKNAGKSGKDGFFKMAAMLGKIFNPDSPNEIPFIEFALEI
jgi:hypothetical protein